MLTFGEIPAGAIPVAKLPAIHCQRSGTRHGGQARLGRGLHLLRSLGGGPRPDSHRHCPGRGGGVGSPKSGPAGTRGRKTGSGKNKGEVRAKLAELHDDLNDGVVSDVGYTVAVAIRDYLADALPGRAPMTISTQREVLEPLIPILGNVPLRELTAADVRSALIKLAAT